MAKRRKASKTTIQIVQVEHGGEERHVRKLTVYEPGLEVLAAIEEMIRANRWGTPGNRDSAPQNGGDLRGKGA